MSARRFIKVIRAAWLPGLGLVFIVAQLHGVERMKVSD
jgi:hypothetical protein